MSSGYAGSMRIGELARQSGVPATTLRYYEQLGLLPEPERTASGYRSYAEAAVDRLAFIRSAQAVGLTLAEAREVLGVRDGGEAPCRVVTQMVDRRHAEVRARIAELRVLERDLARLRDRAARLEPRDCDPSGVCHIIPRQGVERRQPITNVTAP
jgi:DNA-binding transcriptional MerR regulator